MGITPKRLVSSVIKEIMQRAGSQKGGIWQVSQASVVDHPQPQKQSDDRAVLWGSADACPVLSRFRMFCEFGVLTIIRSRNHFFLGASNHDLMGGWRLAAAI